jgi:hypothetical protein
MYIADKVRQFPLLITNPIAKTSKLTQPNQKASNRKWLEA